MNTPDAHKIARAALNKAWIREEMDRIRARRERIANEIRETEDAIDLLSCDCPVLAGVANDLRARIATLTARLAEGFTHTQIASLGSIALAVAHAAEAQGLGRAWIREPSKAVKRGAASTNGCYADQTLVRVYAKGGTFHALRGAVPTGAFSGQRQDPRITEIHNTMIADVTEIINAAI